MNAWCVGCGEPRDDVLPGSPLACRSCPHCHGPYAVEFGDSAPGGAGTHPVRAQDVPALLPKVIG